MSELQQFLYVLLKESEKVKKTGKLKTDTVLRIVYWAANAEFGYDSHFVIYGQRPDAKVSGKYVPYRLKCQTPKQVQQFVRTVIGNDNELAVELHQFYGNTDDTEDWYNIDWENTYEDSSTELIAFDLSYTIGYDGVPFIDFESSLSSVLNAIVNYEVV